jgi:hypothetical protein
MEIFTNRPKKYLEVSNIYSSKIKFVDKSEIDYDSTDLKLNVTYFQQFFSKFVTNLDTK